MEFKLYMILGYVMVAKVESDCGTVYKDVHSFGPECRYRCNCKNNQQCNNVTGECQGGCQSGWMGPSCQYRNLANRILSSKQNPATDFESEKASVATDGNITTCSRTGSVGGQSEQTYWQAELQELTYIVGFVIKIKQEDAGRFQGFSINVGNDTSVAEICYRHGANADGNSIMDMNCEKPIVGRYFRIQLAESENQPLVLCEVEIYGGRLVSFNKPTLIASTLGYYGTWDSFYAVDGRHPIRGEDQENETIRTCAATGVSSSAIDKWWSLDLNNTYSIIAVSFYGRHSNRDQFDGFFVKTGLNSNSLQLVFKDSRPFSDVNGYVPKSKNFTWPVDGAIAKVERNGVILFVCELEVFADCKYGSCGWECNETCMCSSQTTGTHKIQGTCPHGCSVRWTGLGNRCYNECRDNTWGQDCNNTCGNCVETCYAATGDCFGSCKPGFIPPACIQECSDGKYGTNCSFTCGFCTNGPYCSKTTGDCKSGCEPGYKGQKCIDTCETGKYGDGCNNTCGNCFNNTVCTPINGSCPGGCTAGYFGKECKIPCISGWYGPNCNSKCGYCDSAADCDKTTGKCSNGCLSGWLGFLCKDPCEDGLYGVNCTSSCGNCSNNEPCDKTSGDCRACAPGYQMKNCIEKCTTGRFGEGCLHKCHCKDGLPCDIVTGYCPNTECDLGWKGHACNISISLADSSKTAIHGGIAGGIIASLVVIASVIALLVMWKKRKSCIRCKNVDANKRVKAEKNEPETSYYNLGSSGNSGHSDPQQLEFSSAVPTYESLRNSDEQSRNLTYECLQDQTNNASVSSKFPEGNQNVEQVYVNTEEEQLPQLI